MSMTAKDIKNARAKNTLALSFVDELNNEITAGKQRMIAQGFDTAQIRIKPPEGITDEELYQASPIKEVMDELEKEGFIDIKIGGSGTLGEFKLSFSLPPDEE